MFGGFLIRFSTALEKDFKMEMSLLCISWIVVLYLLALQATKR